MSFIQQPAYILFVLFLLILFAEWLAQKSFFKHIGSAFIVIIAAALLSNLHLLPASTHAPPLYTYIFEYAAPLGIFFLLLDVKLKNLKQAGLPMLAMFLIGALATMTGAVVSYWIVMPQLHQVSEAYAVAGMFTGTYIGGSANLNAVALNYGVQKSGTLYAAVNAVDNILTAFWLFMTLLLPPLLQKYFPKEKQRIPEFSSLSDVKFKSPEPRGKTQAGLIDTALLLAFGFGSLYLSSLVSKLIPGIPSILVLTSLALISAQIPVVQELRGGKLMGSLLIMIFLAVIGAYCDLEALNQSGDMAVILLVWDSLLIGIHGLLIFIIGGLLKQDWDVVSIASNANIGGAASAPVCAASLGRTDLQLPGLLAGSIGNAIGTYLGILVAEFLK